MNYRTYLFLFLIFVSRFCLAQGTDVTNHITSSQHWTLENSPYNIRKGINIEQNVILTIEPGVKVNFYHKDGIDVFGTVIVKGTKTSENIVEFKSFLKKTDLTQAKCFKTRGNAKMIINGARIKDNNYFIFVGESSDSIFISQSLFFNNFTPLTSQNKNFCQLRDCSFASNNGCISNMNVEVDSSHFSSNTSIVMESVSGTIRNTTFFENIDVIKEADEVNIINCEFTRNTGFHTLHISAGSGKSSIENCSILENNKGIEISAVTDSSVVLRNNRICNKDFNLDNKSNYIVDASYNCWCNKNYDSIIGLIKNTSLGTTIFKPLHGSCRPCQVEAGEDLLWCSNDTSFSLGTIDTIDAAYESYQWEPADGLMFPQKPKTKGRIENRSTEEKSYKYKLTLTNVTSNCTASDSVTVTVLPDNNAKCRKCKADAGQDISVCSKIETRLGAGISNPYYTYLWEPSEGLSDPNIGNPVFIVTNEGRNNIERQYRLTIYDQEAGCADSDTLNIIVYPKYSPDCEDLPLIKIYNVITVNHDDLNNYFTIDNIQYYPDHLVTIYNRWGIKVFQTKHYNNDWDGGGLPEGTYYYIVSVPMLGSDFKGSLLIKR